MEPETSLGRVSAVFRTEPPLDPYVTGSVPMSADHDGHRDVHHVAASVVEVVAFESFYASSRIPIGRALALTLRDADLAADALDEAMVRAYQRWRQVSRLDNPSGWVYRVALNYARSRLRRLRRRPPGQPEMHEVVIADPSVAAAIAKLSLDHRAVVVCRYLLGWSEAMTAQSLGIRPGTAKSRLHRALQQLESQLHHLRMEETP